MDVGYSWGAEPEAPVMNQMWGWEVQTVFTLPGIEWIQSVESWETLASVWHIESNPTNMGKMIETDSSA